MIGAGLYYFYDYWQTFSKPIETKVSVAAPAASPEGVDVVAAPSAVAKTEEIDLNLLTDEEVEALLASLD